MSYSDDTAEFMFTGQEMRETMPEYEITHRTPPKGSGVMPCCGLPPFERRNDRMTSDPELVTCGIVDFAAADAELAAGKTRPLSDWYRPSGDTQTIRKACRHCGNSYSFHCIGTTDEGWVFECRRCGMTHSYTDKEVTGWKE